MKHVLRAAGTGFGGALGVGAALILGGALVAIVTRTAVKKTFADGMDQLREYIDQAADKLSEAPDQTRPDQDHVHTPSCPCPAWLKSDSGVVLDTNRPEPPRCGAAFGGGQGPCILELGHDGRHVDYIPS